MKLKQVRKIAQLALFLGALATAPGAPGAATPGVSLKPYQTWDKAIYLHSDRAETRMVVVPSIGGRLMRFEKMGESPLWENPANRRLKPGASGPDLIFGGAQVDVITSTPDASSRTQAWNGDWKVETMRDYQATLSFEPDAASGLKWIKEFTLDPDSGAAGLVFKVLNQSLRAQTVSLRYQVLCKSYGYLVLPLNKSSRLPARWSLWRESGDKGAFDNIAPESPNVRVSGKILTAHADTTPTRLGADSDAQWIGYVEGNYLFIQYFPYVIGGNYPGHGHTVEVAWTRDFVNIEIIGAETSVPAGGSLVMPGQWNMVVLKKPVKSLKDAKNLEDLVPPSPFGP